MHVQQVRDADGRVVDEPPRDLLEAVTRCTNADLDAHTGDPTELALLEMADTAGIRLNPVQRAEERVAGAAGP